MPKLHVHARVSWLCRPKDGGKPFVCQGEVLKLKVTTFGGSVRAMGATVHVISKAYLQRRHATKTVLIRASNLTVITSK